jgi:hypothetical protein
MELDDHVAERGGCHIVYWGQRSDPRITRPLDRNRKADVGVLDKSQSGRGHAAVSLLASVGHTRLIGNKRQEVFSKML